MARVHVVVDTEAKTFEVTLGKEKPVVLKWDEAKFLQQSLAETIKAIDLPPRYVRTLN